MVKFVSHLMEKDQLISMIHFLEKRDEESKKENEELTELLKSLREEYREDAEQTRYSGSRMLAWALAQALRSPAQVTAE